MSSLELAKVSVHHACVSHHFLLTDPVIWLPEWQWFEMITSADLVTNRDHWYESPVDNPCLYLMWLTASASSAGLLLKTAGLKVTVRDALARYSASLTHIILL